MVGRDAEARRARVAEELEGEVHLHHRRGEAVGLAEAGEVGG
jgi:hypothetical protein